MPDSTPDTAAKPTTIGSPPSHGNLSDFRPVKLEAVRCLPPDHPIRQLMVAEPDEMPFDVFAWKVVRYICLAIEYRHNTDREARDIRK